MKISLVLSLTVATVFASLVPASAEDRQVTVYSGTSSITIPASTLAATQSSQQVATSETTPARKIRVVLASPYRSMN
ncbi:hypothetical protein FPV16_21240 [Methylobacterium sp. W2]|uniref:hypothetical protein n=1 Tax=Methylobacterium sp. W2 TaxID=2598107 RepID=UPI000480E03B|nr:hypothetical protein [Methylobacterium sp. W2]MCC0808699.1 hypothetical protein [Methylobacterium sp. W2]